MQEIIGGWRSKSIWDLVDAAAAGEASEALALLDRLLHAGEHPLALVGSLSWSLRRYAAATRLFQQAERAGKRISLRDALTQAGFRDWPPGAVAAGEKRLMQLGRHRAGKLYRWLLELDLSLKGSHSHEERGPLGLGAARAANGKVAEQIGCRNHVEQASRLLGISGNDAQARRLCYELPHFTFSSHVFTTQPTLASERAEQFSGTSWVVCQ